MRRSHQDADTRRGTALRAQGEGTAICTPGREAQEDLPAHTRTWDSSLRSGNRERLRGPCSDVVGAAPACSPPCPPPFPPMLPDLSRLSRTAEPSLPGGLCSAAPLAGPGPVWTEPDPGPRSRRRRTQGMPPWERPQSQHGRETWFGQRDIGTSGSLLSGQAPRAL